MQGKFPSVPEPWPLHEAEESSLNSAAMGHTERMGMVIQKRSWDLLMSEENDVRGSLSTKLKNQV